ncbi:hypothetical protein HY745_06130 [Candidatus Desantisbacteria bacterium]|nr:hypothetical protein [Candidatus Desantisbacteria bacterium]
MPEYVLIDCNRIQAYVFASNRLKQICNASMLLADIEENIIPKIAEKNNVEIIRSGGGLTIAKFEGNNKNNAQKFLIESEKIFREYGIEVTIIKHTTKNEPVNFFDEVIHPSIKKLNKKKTQLKSPMLSISSILAVPCEESGIGSSEGIIKLPDKKYRRCNLTEKGKNDFFKKLKKEYTEIEKELIETHKDYKIPRDFGGIVNWTTTGDNIQKDCGTSESMLLGIIYADINGLGTKTKDIADTEINYADFCFFLKERINTVVRDSLKNVIKNAIKKKREALPIRILYIGGDDLAIAVQGALALDVAKELLHRIKVESEELMTELGIKKVQNLTMSAGVVIASYKYPILAFNQLGHELEQRAKIHSRNNKNSGYIDFCIIKNNAIGKLQEIRKSKIIRDDNNNIDFLLYGGPYLPEDIDNLNKAAILLGKNFLNSKLKELQNIFYQKKFKAEVDYEIWKKHLTDEQEKNFKEVLNLLKLPDSDKLPLIKKDHMNYDSTLLIDAIEMIGLIKVGENNE